MLKALKIKDLIISITDVTYLEMQDGVTMIRYRTNKENPHLYQSYSVIECRTDCIEFILE